MKDHQNVPQESEVAGAKVTLKFNGTGLALAGNLSDNGRRADIHVDDKKNKLVHCHELDLGLAETALASGSCLENAGLCGLRANFANPYS